MEEETGEDLEELRRRKMLDLRRSLAEEQRRAQAQEQMRAKKEAALKMILSPEARLRLANIRMVKPEFAETLEVQLIQLAQTGKVPLPISDDLLKNVLARLQTGRKDFSIRRI
ncbi:MAG: DNA-binding protein [Candidatus Bathyarchaeia archaeon]